MAKDYGRRRSVKQKSSITGQLFWILASFLCGYLAATVFDLTSLTTWVNSNILAKGQEAKPAAKVVAKQTEKPKPKFEFYTLLTKDQKTASPGSRSPTAVRTKPLAPQQNGATTIASSKAAAEIGRGALQPTVAVNEAKPLAPVSNSKEAYQIQIAAFRRRQDAEHMQAVLTLKGFDVSVTSFSQQHVDWYRVIVGPFKSREAAERTQLTLAKTERIKGMIRKMSA